MWVPLFTDIAPPPWKIRAGAHCQSTAFPYGREKKSVLENYCLIE